MLVIKNNPPRSGKTEIKSETGTATDLSGPVPSYDPFSDDELWRRVGEVIARSGRPPFWPIK